MQGCKDKIEVVYGQNFADTGVVVENEGFSVSFGVEITHAKGWHPDKLRVTEDCPGFIRPRNEALPKDSEWSRRLWCGGRNLPRTIPTVAGIFAREQSHS